MGGQKAQEPTIIQAPTTPAPSPQETSAQAMQAQIAYNPQLYAQYAQMYGQYMPQIAGTDVGIQQQYAPQIRALQQQMFPQQTQLVEAMAGQALQRMESPFGYTPEEQAAVGAIRGRETQRLSQQMRERANLGGTLYGGRAEDLESRATQELAQAFASEDINRRLQGSQQALQYATPVAQILYPQISQPQMPNYTQPVVPSADTLYNAYYGASQPQYYATPGYQATGGFGSALAGGLGQGVGMAGGAMLAGALHI